MAQVAFNLSGCPATLHSKIEAQQQEPVEAAAPAAAAAAAAATATAPTAAAAPGALNDLSQ